MKPVKRVLCPTDFSDESKSALLYATQVASLFDAEIHLLHATVLHDSGTLSAFPSYQVFETTISEKARVALDKLLPTAATRRLKIERVEQRGVAAGEVILDYVDANEIDMVVMGTHGRRGLRRLFLGSVAQEVVRLSPVPVLTVRSSSTLGRGEGGCILAPVDFSPMAEEVVATAARFARWMDSRVVVLHVMSVGAVPDPRALSMPSALGLPDREAVRSELQQIVERVAPGDERFSVEVVRGGASDAILAAGRKHQPDLVVLGSHDAGLVDRVLLGSVAERVVQRAEWSVLTLKGTAQQAGGDGELDLGNVATSGR